MRPRFRVGLRDGRAVSGYERERVPAPVPERREVRILRDEFGAPFGVDDSATTKYVRDDGASAARSSSTAPSRAAHRVRLVGR